MLENSSFLLQFEQKSAKFSFLNHDNCFPSLIGNSIEVTGTNNQGITFDFVLDMEEDSIANQNKDSVSYAGLHNESGLEWTVEFISENDPDFMMWRVHLLNTSGNLIWIDRINVLDSGKESKTNTQFPEDPYWEKLAFFSNGWQSWSHSGAYKTNQKMNRSRLGLLQNPMVINPGTPVFRKKGKFSSDFFGVIADPEREAGLLLGFLSQKQHFGTITFNAQKENIQLDMWANGDHTRLDPGKEMHTDWALLCPVDFKAEQPITHYLDAVAAEHKIRNNPNSPSGWCSWYYYYQNISEKIIRNNLQKVAGEKERLPLDVMQIDDGFEKWVGDWSSFSVGFPEGVKPLANEIRKKGMKPGIWLAPFILEPKSLVAREHPEWLLKQENGKLARAGFVWNSLGVALDLTNPEAMHYARQVVHTAVEEWGFEYLKLDFLYAAALRCQYTDSTKTRAQVLRMGLESLREAAGEGTTLVGCGVPLGSALGLVDTMRISADVSDSWAPSFFHIKVPFRKEPHMPSARNSMQNIITRAPFHGKWWINDPDCFIANSASGLSTTEVNSLATAIALSGGAFFISDDLTKLEESRIRLVSFLLPPINKTPSVLDWISETAPAKLRLDLTGEIGRWSLFSFFNWRDSYEEISISKRDFGLEEKDYLVRSVWQERNWTCRDGQPLYRGSISPHGVVLLAVRKLTGVKPCYMGGDFHISQGKEICLWKEGREYLQVEITGAKNGPGYLDVYSPKGLNLSENNNGNLILKKLNPHFYRIRLLKRYPGAIRLRIK